MLSRKAWCGQEVGGGEVEKIMGGESDHRAGCQPCTGKLGGEKSCKGGEPKGKSYWKGRK